MTSGLYRMSLSWHLQSLSLRSVMTLLVVSVVFSNEYLVYWIQSWTWPPMSVTSRNPNEELVVLFVSDPQLIGMQDELGFPLGMITRWDSDRYMRKSFSMAYSYSQPDVVVFLGDLMDEGGKATDEEYQSYYDRFHSIFNPSALGSYYDRFHSIFNPISLPKVVYIPGNNDIGGEEGDFRTRLKTSRFERNFENVTGVVKAHFVDFIKLDIRSQIDAFAEKKQMMLEMTHSMTAPVRILLNHETIISQRKMQIYPLLKIAQPNLIFTGHWHESFHYMCETCLSNNEDSAYWPVQLHDIRTLMGWKEVDFTSLISLNEITVPTCSYRMGTNSMGFGFGLAVIQKSGSMEYTVLWLPNRYTQFLAYLVALPVLFVIIFTLNLIICFGKKHRR